MLIVILLLIILVESIIFIIGAIFDTDLLGEVGFKMIVYSFLIMIVVMIVPSVLPTIEVLVQTQNILALNDSTNIKGNYFLFSGYVDEELTYRYVVDTDKGKHVESCDADNTYIKENTDGKHCIEHYKSEFKYQWMRTWFICLDISSYDIIYVPKGSITTKYNIDLE